MSSVSPNALRAPFREPAFRNWGVDRMPFIDQRIWALRAAEGLDGAWPGPPG